MERLLYIYLSHHNIFLKPFLFTMTVYAKRVLSLTCQQAVASCFQPLMFQRVQPASICPRKAGNHTLIHHDNQLYLVGGVSRPVFGSGVLWFVGKFNLLTNTWEHVGKDYPFIYPHIQKSFPKAVLFGNGLLIIYILSGGRGFLFPFSGNRKFTFVRLTWSGDKPQLTHTLAIISCPDDSCKVYVFQPRLSEGMNVVDVYTLKITDLNGHWEKLDVTGECKYTTTDIDEDVAAVLHDEDVAAVLHDRKVYICNAPVSDSGDFRKLYAFNLDTLSWETVLTTHKADGTWPLARHFHSVVLFNDIVYFVGGMTAEHFFDDVLHLNLKTKKWDTTRNLSLSEKLGLTSATVTPDGCVYVFGGYNDRRLYTDQLQKFWLKPPPLKWTAFHKVKQMYASSSNGQINESDPKALLAMGIPPDLVRTLQE